MIALTQDKREELIAHNTEKLKGLKNAVAQTAFESVKGKLELEIQSTEITLASLTEKPYGSCIAGALSNDNDWDTSTDLYSNSTAKLMADAGYKLMPLFPSPPVPEIKVPEKLDIGEIHYELTEKHGMNLSFDQLERGVADEVYSLAVKNFNLLNGWGE